MYLITENSSTRSKQKALNNLLIELDRICKKHGLEYFAAYGTALGAVREKGFIKWDDDIDIKVKVNTYKKFQAILKEEIGDDFYVYDRYNCKHYTALFSRLGYKNVEQHLLHIDIFPIAGTSNNTIVQKFLSFFLLLLTKLHYIKRVEIKKRLSKKSKVFIAWTGKIILTPFPSSFFSRVHKFLSELYPVENSKYFISTCGTYGQKEIYPAKWFLNTKTVEFEEMSLPICNSSDEYLSHLYGNYMKPKKY